MLLRTLGLGGKSSSATLETVGPYNLFDHSSSQTLLEATELTSVPPSLVHRTVLVSQANILGVLLDSSLEESLATFTGPHSIMLTGCMISTYGAHKPR